MPVAKIFHLEGVCSCVCACMEGEEKREEGEREKEEEEGGREGEGRGSECRGHVEGIIFNFYPRLPHIHYTWLVTVTPPTVIASYQGA